eukprot:4041591-Amphidinium_carterae.2
MGANFAFTMTRLPALFRLDCTQGKRPMQRTRLTSWLTEASTACHSIASDDASPHVWFPISLVVSSRDYFFTKHGTKNIEPL